MRQALLKSAHEFVSKDLSPRLTKAREAAEKQVRQKLEDSGIYTDKRALESAVASSAIVQEIAGLRLAVTINMAPMHGPEKYARELLEISERIDQVAAKL